MRLRFAQNAITILWMPPMFEHHLFRVYDFADIPKNRDIFLMDERWMAEWESGMVKMFNGGEYPVVGYISYAAVRNIRRSAMELSWYPNIHSRFHEMKIVLPRDQFLTCVDCYEYDQKPHLFVKGGWLSHIHLRTHSIFALIDAIGMKDALLDGKLSRSLLVRLRKRVDTVAKKYGSISFISFADSLLLKTNWRVGQYDSKIKYNYEPELFIRVLLDVRKVYQDVLGMRVYAVLTQGSNEYYDDALLHISGNHISLNSLGLPFAQLLSIDEAARTAIRSGAHVPADLYMDEDFYHSLNFVHEFAMTKDRQQKNSYRSPMGAGPGCYYYSSFENIETNLKIKPRQRR